KLNLAIAKRIDTRPKQDAPSAAAKTSDARNAMMPGKASAVWTRETSKAAQYAQSSKTSPTRGRKAAGLGSTSGLFMLSYSSGASSTLCPYTRKHFRDQGAVPQLPMCQA